MLVGPIYAYMHMYNRTNKSTKVWSKLWEMNTVGTVKPNLLLSYSLDPNIENYEVQMHLHDFALLISASHDA